MGDGLLAVQEEGVGGPDVAGQQVVQGQHLHGPLETQPLVLPALAEEHVDGVLLEGDRGAGVGGRSVISKALNCEKTTNFLSATYLAGLIALCRRDFYGARFHRRHGIWTSHRKPH